VGSLGSTENVQTILELLPCSVEHVRWNSRDRIPDTGLQVIKSVNWCSEHIALDITPHEKIQWCIILLVIECVYNPNQYPATLCQNFRVLFLTPLPVRNINMGPIFHGYGATDV
jgi:hypothetical protein